MPYRKKRIKISVLCSFVLYISYILYIINSICNSMLAWCIMYTPGIDRLAATTLNSTRKSARTSQKWKTSKGWFGEVQRSSELGEQNPNICLAHIISDGTIRSRVRQAITYLKGDLTARSVWMPTVQNRRKKNICVIKVAASFFVVEVHRDYVKKCVNISDVRIDLNIIE